MVFRFPASLLWLYFAIFNIKWAEAIKTTVTNCRINYPRTSTECFFFNWASELYYRGLTLTYILMLEKRQPIFTQFAE